MCSSTNSPYFTKNLKKYAKCRDFSGSHKNLNLKHLYKILLYYAQFFLVGQTNFIHIRLYIIYLLLYYLYISIYIYILYTHYIINYI